MKSYLLFALLLIGTLPLFGVWLIDENFDTITTLPQGWTIHDDGDGNLWRNLNNASHAHSGTRAAFCDNYLPNQNADWLITPQLSIATGDSLKFYTRSWVSTENLQVKISTSGTAPANFSNLMLNLQNIGSAYQEASCNLSAFAGQNIYIGFYWECDNYGILVDDVKVGQPTIINAELNLPASFSFVQGESLSVDFSPFITTTELSSSSITWSTPQHISITANGLVLTLASPEWNGTENITFTLHDNISGQTASDNADIIVSPQPQIDLKLSEVISPRQTEYLDSPFIPEVMLQNNGLGLWDDQVSVLFTVTNQQGTQVVNNVAMMSQALQPGQLLEVSFEPVTISTAGTYSYSFVIDLADGNPANNTLGGSFDAVLRINSGGPDAFGYRYLDSTVPGGPVFDWVDITATGISTVMYGVPTWGGDDNFSEPIPLGFSFPFYGNSYDTAHVDINGEILLAPNTWFTEYPDIGWNNDGNMFNYMHPIPGYTQMPALIAAYWDDLYVEQGTGDIYFQNFGMAPNRYTVIQWHHVRFLAGSGATELLDFETILRENGEIVMQYNKTATHQTGANVPHDHGRSATVAIQNQDATMGMAYLREIVQNNQYQGVEPAGNLLFDGLAIRFFSGPDQQAPYITYEPIGNTFDTTPLLTARIIDLNEITQAQLHYNAGGSWQTLDGMSDGANNYGFSMPDLPLGAVIQYYFSAEDEFGNSGTLPLTAPTEYFSFKILPDANSSVLIAYSGRQDYQRTELPLYQARLDALNISYDVFDYEAYDDYSLPLTYSAIIVYASVGRHDNYTLHLSEALMDYMNAATPDHKKNVFLASDGWATTQHGHPNSDSMVQLFRGYFRTHYVPTAGVGGGGTNGLAGPEVYSYNNGTILCLQDSPLGTAGTEYPVYANSPDCIFADDAVPDWMVDQVPYPNIGASNAFIFEDGPVGGHAYLYHGSCATYAETPATRTFFFSFDYSQLTNQAQSLEFMSDLMAWFEVHPSDNDDPGVTHVQNALLGNYPNPFNPNTTISYSLAKTAPVELCIYNLKGQKVTTLISDSKTAGLHQIAWNGTDTYGRAVGSGIYFVKMQIGKATLTRKLTLVK